MRNLDRAAARDRTRDHLAGLSRNCLGKDRLGKGHLQVFHAVHRAVVPDAQRLLFVIVDEDDLEGRIVRSLGDLALAVFHSGLPVVLGVGEVVLDVLPASLGDKDEPRNGRRAPPSFERFL